MELLIAGVVAIVIVIATIIRDLRQKSRRTRAGSDPQSERALRDFRHGRTLGQLHFVGLDNTGDRR